jgi:hypothetical protein
MAGKRSQKYICPKCGSEKTIYAPGWMKTKDFIKELLSTVQCGHDGCREWMARAEEVQAAG